jgi:DNA-binding response OmpR family regulator
MLPAGTFPGSFQVRFACDAIRLVAETRRELPSAILVDLNLPAGNGWEMVGRLRTFPDLVVVPILVMGPSEARISARLVVSSDADGFLTKPIVRHKLLPVLAHLLSRPRRPTTSFLQALPPLPLVPGSDLSIFRQKN